MAGKFIIIIISAFMLISCGKGTGKKKNVTESTKKTQVSIDVHKLSEMLEKGSFNEFIQKLSKAPVSVANDLHEGRGLLHLACKKGSVKAVKALLDKGSRLDLRDKTGKTPLHYAILNKEVVKILLERKSSPEWSDSAGITPVHLASQNGDPEILEMLIKSGGDKNSPDNSGLTPLHYATGNKNTKVLDYLIKSKASLTAKSSDGYDPFLYAVKGGSLENVEKLIKARLWIKRRLKNGDYATHIAVRNQHYKILEYFIEKKKFYVDLKNFSSLTPLHLAAVIGDVKAIRYLISKKAYMGMGDRSGFQPLHLAVLKGKIEAVKVLTEKKTWIDHTDYKKRTPLHLAILKKQNEIAKFLIQAGASITKRDRENNSTIHFAAMSGNLELIKLLAEKGQKLDAKGAKGLSPLHHAVANGHLEIVKWLVENKASLKAKDYKANQPLHLALTDSLPSFPNEITDYKKMITDLEKQKPLPEDKLSQYKKIVEFLEKETKEDSDLRTRKIACAKFLIEKGADLTSTDENGRNSIQIAAASGMKDVFDILKNKKISGDKKDYAGRKLLEHAAMGGNLDIVKDVMAMGFDEIKFKYRRETPLHLAAMYNRTDVLSYLIEKEGDPGAKNHKNETVLMYATRKMAWQSAGILVKAGAKFPIPDTKIENENDKPKQKKDFTGYKGFDPDDDPHREEHAEFEKKLEESADALDENTSPVLYVIEKILQNKVRYGRRSMMSNLLLNRMFQTLDVFFKNGLSPDAVIGDFPLIYNAVMENHEEFAEFILLHKPSLENVKGMTIPLISGAMVGGQLKMLAILLDGGVKPQLEKEKDIYCLHNFISDDLKKKPRTLVIEVFEKLVKAGCSPTEKDELGDTPLHFAASRGLAYLVELLVEKNVKIDAENTVGITPLEEAIRGGSVQAVKLIMAKGAKLEKLKNKERIVDIAAEGGSVEIIKLLEKEGFKDKEYKNGAPGAAFAAALHGHYYAFLTLASKKNVDLKVTDENGATIAHYAAKGGSEQIIDYLLKKKIAFDSVDNNKKTVIHWLSSQLGANPPGTALEKLNINLDSADKDGLTALHLAVKNNNVKLAQWLLKKGVKTDLKDKDGKTAGDYAKQKEMKKLLNIVDAKPEDKTKKPADEKKDKK
ncbi:ankyrin repeat domain-containing protein [Myxococcota bacterium]|nr:ankyrin repeat domain-containing protein [Myxococcota bacterium]MBU1381401.1 ankyrin repeat domain-containing protein [Myxococcota bacterium]MBU1498413.1 ankyrin repeat domain-containing protein [Myxococcota bacterium]